MHNGDRRYSQIKNHGTIIKPWRRLPLTGFAKGVVRPPVAARPGHLARPSCGGSCIGAGRVLVTTLAASYVTPDVQGTGAISKKVGKWQKTNGRVGESNGTVYDPL